MTTIDGTDAVIVTCCHCGARFDERLIGGSFLDRHCPSCKRRISEDDYDALAASDDEQHLRRLTAAGTGPRARASRPTPAPKAGDSEHAGVASLSSYPTLTVQAPSPLRIRLTATSPAMRRQS